MSLTRAEAPDPSTPARRGGSGDPRIILVGRTGLEVKLRSLGPVRVRRALDAIGELADPLSHGGDNAPVVVVGADADPGAGGEAKAGEYVRALRRVEPRVRVLRVGTEAGVGAYDGMISADDSAEMTIDAISGAAAKSAPNQPATAAAPGPPRGPSVREVESLIEFMLDGESAQAQAGDAELVGLMLRGREIAPAALRLARERSGDADLQFVPDENQGEAAGPARGVAVTWQGHRFGWLTGGGSTGPEAIAPQARWLAGWLALAAQQTQLRSEAFSDALTGAWNRRYFERFMAAALQTAQRDRHHLTVLAFDIDDFKKYNDEFGHAAGDSILVETVRLLQSVIRPSDKVCRIGGDEFVVIFHEPDGPRLPTSKPPESISEIAQRFQRQICEHKFPKLGEQAPGTLTISGGLATFPWDGRTADELLARADELARKGKRAGKNTIVFGPGAVEACGTGDEPPMVR